ncbi:MAG: hypothetical protein AAGA31_12295 [Bacteroidota bacterium]
MTSDEGQDHAPKWAAAQQLYYLSARDGRYNLYRMPVSGQAEQR